MTYQSQSEGETLLRTDQRPSVCNTCLVIPWMPILGSLFVSLPILNLVAQARMAMKSTLLAVAVLQTTLILTFAASPPCYSPKGNQVSHYGVCDFRLPASLCCIAGDTCLTNGLCFTKTETFYRGGCSDKSYHAGLCPSFCIDGQSA